MATRIILGQNAGAFNATGQNQGLWISKPGKQATSSAIGDFLVAPGLNNVLSPLSVILAAGSSIPFVSQGTSTVVSIDSYGDAAALTPCVYGLYWPHSLGFVPMIWTDITQSPNSNSYYSSTTSFPTSDAQPYQGVEWYVVSYADSSQVGIEFHATLETQLNYGGTITNYPIASDFVLNVAIHFAVMAVQVA